MQVRLLSLLMLSSIIVGCHLNWPSRRWRVIIQMQISRQMWSWMPWISKSVKDSKIYILLLTKLSHFKGWKFNTNQKKVYSVLYWYLSLYTLFQTCSANTIPIYCNVPNWWSAKDDKQLFYSFPKERNIISNTTSTTIFQRIEVFE